MPYSDKGLSQAIGEMLRIYRTEQGYTRSELSRMLKVSIQQIHKYETGINRISVNKFADFCSALKIEPTRIGNLILNLVEGQE